MALFQRKIKKEGKCDGVAWKNDIHWKKDGSFGNRNQTVVKNFVQK